MTRSELVKAISGGYPKYSVKDIDQALKHIFDSIGGALQSLHRVEIRGFGSFSVSYRDPRKVRNPKSGETLISAGKYVVHFKPGKDLREKVNALAAEYPLRANLNQEEK